MRHCDIYFNQQSITDIKPPCQELAAKKLLRRSWGWVSVYCRLTDGLKACVVVSQVRDFFKGNQSISDFFSFVFE